MKERILQTSAVHRAVYDGITAVLAQAGDQLKPEEQLAILAHMVGKVMALQDQRTMSRERALQIVIRNIEEGNLEVVTHLGQTQGKA